MATEPPRKAPDAVDRLVREMLNHGGNRVWVEEDVEEWRDNQDLVREIRKWWTTGGKEAAAFAQQRLTARRSRHSFNGKLLWALLSAILTVLGGVAVAYLVPHL